MIKQTFAVQVFHFFKVVKAQVIVMLEIVILSIKVKYRTGSMWPIHCVSSTLYLIFMVVYKSILFFLNIYSNY